MKSDKELKSIENILGIYFVSSLLAFGALTISLLIWDIKWIIACSILQVINIVVYTHTANKRDKLAKRKDGANAN